MKNLVTSLVLAVSLMGLTAAAQTSVSTNQAAITSPSLSLTNVESGKKSGAWEFTLGGGGTEIKGESAFGMDFSISTNPFKKRPEIWIGIAQGLYWEPTFAGSTDLFVDWSWNLWKDTLYLNTGWSVGGVYDNSGTSAIWRTGPEATLQYYTSDNAFIFAGLNWDFQSRGDNGLRYSFGVGLSF